MNDREFWPGEPVASDFDEIDDACDAAEREFRANPSMPSTETERAAIRAHGRGHDAFRLSESAIAHDFAQRQTAALRYCHGAGAWFRWGGNAWTRDQTAGAFTLARLHCAGVAQSNPADAQAATTLGKAATVRAVLMFAQTDPELAVTADAWDRDPFLLGTPGGTVDLRTGNLRPATQTDYITRLTAVVPAKTADCPLWLAFLDQATGGDVDLIRFLAQWCGYGLTGDVREQALLFVYGSGGNGKGVFLNTINGIMAAYGCVAPAETFAAAQGDRHPAELAMLKGARLVVASETEEGKAWAESRIKSMTGGEPITARVMRGDFFTFMPQFKLTVVGNHKPELRNVDDAARRRFNMVPFTRKPAKKDLDLEAKMRAEWPAILRWMIDGCLDWQRNGLIRPAVVTEATAEYFEEQDSLRQWVEERCDTGPHQSDTTVDLFRSWTAYAQAAGERPGNNKRFSQTLGRMGFEATKHVPGNRGKRGFIGIAARREANPSFNDRDDDAPF